MRRKVLARSVRTVIEQLEGRTLLSATAVQTPAVQTHAVTTPASTHYTKQVLNVGTGISSIFGTLYEDLNANGIQDPNEPVIVGGVVYLDLNNNGTLDPDDVSTTTDSAGGFGFTNLADGTYTVRIIPNQGFHQPSPGFASVAVVGGAQQVVEIGELNLTQLGNSTVSGTVFDDVNQDGVYDPINEWFLANDTVYVDLNNNGVLDPGEPSAATNNVGFYTFTLAPGTYDIRVIPRPGFHQDPPGFYTIDLANGDQDIANIGENNSTTLSGYVFDDLNGNGILDPGETIVAGETVWLDENFDNTNSMGTYNPTTGGFDGGDASVTTDFTGLYTFTDLNPGTYRIRITSASGLVQDSPGFVDLTVSQGQIIYTNLGEGAPASVSGTVFNDINANGTLDPGEPGLKNQTVYIDVNNNGVVDLNGNYTDGSPLGAQEPALLTDVNGAYTFSNLGPGTYTFRALFPAGSTATAPQTPSNDYTVTLSAGENLMTRDFGFKTADLTVALLQFPTGPLLAGKTRSAVVRVTNVGSIPSDAIDSINLFASTTTTINTVTDSEIGTMPGTLIKLNPGQSKQIKFYFNFPIQTPTNNYYIAAQVVSTAVDSNTVDDISNVIGPVNVALPFVDMAVTYAAQPPQYVYPGHTTPISVILTNFGNVVNTGVITFRLYTTATNTLEPTDTVIDQLPFRGVRLPPGKSRGFNLTLNTPGTTATARYIVVTIDAGDKLGEYNLNNNIAISTLPTTFL